ncbi:phosphoribosylaminoimidazolesuccinocarboxamide synthase [Nonomuraea sp. NPDC004702]
MLVVSDRVSLNDIALLAPAPDKGRVLAQLWLWWFDQLADLTSDDAISATDLPTGWAGRAARVRRSQMFAMKRITGGYLAGMGLQVSRLTSARRCQYA